MVALQGPVEIGIYSGICEGEGPGSLTVTYDYFRVTTDQDSSTDPNNLYFYVPPTPGQGGTRQHP